MSTDVQDLDAQDLAGQLYRSPRVWQTRSRIDRLLDRYLTLDYLSDRLADLPMQFVHPQPRAWQAVCWQDIDRSQIIGLNADVFLAILKGASAIEEPIRGYARVSGEYLKRFHQPMARFVGGEFAKDGSLIEMGLWEKEERQHSPALAKIYKQLTGEQLAIASLRVKSFQPSADPHSDMYRHGLHRVTTEYGATCLYLWLMAHSTGALQQVLSEILLDEINHTTKFLGFGIWAFSAGDLNETHLGKNFLKNYFLGIFASFRQNPERLSNKQISRLGLVNTFRLVMDLIDWRTWQPVSKLELSYTFLRVMHRLRQWKDSLDSSYLQDLFGIPPQADNSILPEPLAANATNMEIENDR